MFDGLFNVNFMRRKRTFDFSRHVIFIFFINGSQLTNLKSGCMCALASVHLFVCTPRRAACFVLFCFLVGFVYSFRSISALNEFQCCCSCLLIVFFLLVCVLITCYRYQYIFFSMLNVLPMHSLKTNSLQLISLHANG